MNLPVTARVNAKGHLEVGGCDLTELAKEFGTPLYVMDEHTLRERCREYRETFRTNAPQSKVLFASKALSCVPILRIIKEEGLGVDVSSGGEIHSALKAGCDPAKIYVHGNAKTRAEIRYALENGVTRFVSDSASEIEAVAEIAEELKAVAQIMLRVNPGIEAHTHEYIQTGKIDSKFGIGRGQAVAAVRQILGHKALKFLGIHAHIGSQILDPKPYAAEVDVLAKLAREIKTETGQDVDELNAGGGIGISYVEEETAPFLEVFAEQIGRALRDRIKDLKLKTPTLVVEPGRSIVGTAGVTLYSVVSVKEIPNVRTYVMVDGGMADNPRPILYQARYDAMLAGKPNQERDHVVTIAGRYCESGDILIRDLRIPAAEEGDTLAVFGTGAYNYSMASNYNRVPRPALVIVKDGAARLAVRRQTYDDLIREETLS